MLVGSKRLAHDVADFRGQVVASHVFRERTQDERFVSGPEELDEPVESGDNPLARCFVRISFAANQLLASSLISVTAIVACASSSRRVAQNR
jgi:hypothetical protein